mgnify:CR=1 FL=1
MNSSNNLGGSFDYYIRYSQTLFETDILIIRSDSSNTFIDKIVGENYLFFFKIKSFFSIINCFLFHIFSHFVGY